MVHMLKVAAVVCCWSRADNIRVARGGTIKVEYVRGCDVEEVCKGD